MTLKARLILLLTVVIALIITTGGVGISLLRSHTRQLEKISEKHFDALQMANDFGVMSARLESQYLPKLTDPNPDTTYFSEAMLQQYRQRFQDRVARLKELHGEGSDVFKDKAILSNFEKAVVSYLSEFDNIFEPEFGSATKEARAALKQSILEQSHRLIKPTEIIINSLENELIEEKRKGVSEAKSAASFLTWIMLMTSLFVGLIYYLLAKKIIDPIFELTRSVRKVQSGYFDHAVPMRSDDEIGRLASAFNDMAAELRVLKLESDRELDRLDLERRAIINGFPHPIFILTSDGALSHANPEAESLMEDLGLPEKLPEKVINRVEAAIESKEDYLPDEVNSALLLRRNEEEHWYLPRIFEISTSSEREFSGWAVVLIDVTKVRWMDDMKSDLIGTVSHEIKTPITGIRMVLHLLEEGKIGPLNEKQEMMVGSAKDDCERLLATLNNLLQLGRLEGGGNELEMELTDLAILIEGVSDSFAGHIEERKLSISVEVEGKLPPIHADRIRIGQVLTNFLSNAVKHCREGGSIKIRAAKLKSAFVRISVIDDGPGVPPEEQDRIFERFYRKRGEKIAGSGLGLWISREIIRAHHGRIGVSSSPGKETEFFFEIPSSNQ